MPSFEQLENPKTDLATQIISADQELLGSYFRENRTNTEYDSLSPHIVDALLATEDIRFRQHSGIDIRA
ncbi:MAG: transglycosylase domain-containing protein, partial [Bacteroidota bacterium]